MADLRSIYVYAAFTAAVIDLLSIVLIYCAAKDRRLTQPYVAIAACMAGWCAGIALQSLPDFAAVYRGFIDIFPVALMILPAATLHAAWIWSGDDSSRKRSIVIAGYSCAILLCIAYWSGFVYDAPIEHRWGAFRAPGPLFVLHPALAIGCVSIGTAWCIAALRNHDDHRIRLRARSWLIGVFSFVPLGSLNYFATFGVPVPPLGPLGNIVVVGVWGFAALRYNLLEVDRIALRTTGAIIATVAISGPITFGLVWWYQIPLGQGSAFVLLPFCLSAIAGVFISLRLRHAIENSLRHSMFIERRKSKDSIKQLSSELLSLAGHSDVCAHLALRIPAALSLTGSAIIWREAADGTYVLRAASESFAHDINSKVGSICNLEELSAKASAIPIGSEPEPDGFILVGPKASGAALDDTDHALLALIAGQLATVWRNIEQKQHIELQKGEIDGLQKKAEAETVVLRAEVRSATQFSEIIGASPALQKVLEFVSQIGPADSTVLITGETGTGKELVARALHEISARGDRPMVCVNCPAIPQDLAESELFGHERGAFTGAVEARTGQFEMADNGTLFLDEIGDLPMSIQVKLLRVLQEQEIQRLGSNKTLKLNLRIIAATNRDLRAAAEAGEFREDLFFRLSAVQIQVPPLRDRLEDLPALAACFLQRAASRYQKDVIGFTADAVAAMEAYHWPGNIRELQHVVERAALLCPSDRIRPDDLGELASARGRPRSNLSSSLLAEKRRRVQAALDQSGGNQAAAARILGMTRSNFGRLMKSLGLKRGRGD